jgi:hypothetical protein
MAHCKSCNAEILWALGPNGNAMPMDLLPDANGQWQVASDGAQNRARYVQTFERNPAGTYYTSHHATCPFASQHRRARK